MNCSKMTPDEQIEQMRLYLDLLPEGIRYFTCEHPTKPNTYKIHTSKDEVCYQVWQGDLFIRVHMGPKSGKKLKLTDKDMIGTYDVWADIECNFPSHHKNKDVSTFPTKEEVIAILLALDCPPTVIIDSGGGIHAHWILKEVFMYTTEGDRERAQRARDGWVRYLQTKFDNPKCVDTSITDDPRWCRLPGSYNTKDEDDHKPVMVVHSNPDCKYSLDDLEAMIPEEPKKEQRVKHTSNDNHNIKRVKSMLEYLSGHLPSDDVESRPDWVSIKMAIKSAVNDGIITEEEGLEYADRISARLPGGAVDEEVWETLKPNRTGIGKLFKMAWNLGWRSEKKVFHFKEGEYQTIADEITDLVASTHDADHLGEDEAEKFSVYRYLGKVYEVCEGKLIELPKDRLRGRISLRCVLCRKDKHNADVIMPPDRDLIGHVYSSLKINRSVRDIVGIVRAPTFRADGTLVNKAGYDPESKLFYLANELDGIILPEKPTRDQAKVSMNNILREILSDFPFATEDDRAAAIAMLLTMFARDLIPGLVPIFAVTANSPGTGKGLLIEACHHLVHGGPVETTSAVKTDDETAKTLLSYVRNGTAVLHLDNQKRGVPFGGPAVDSYATAAKAGGRVLMTLDVSSALNRMIVTITGNALRFDGDTRRRVCLINLLTTQHRPHDGRMFRHESLLTYIKRNRKPHYKDLLVIVKAWIDAGKPQGQWKLGSFERWSMMIGGLLEFCGIRGSLRAAFQDREGQDEEKDAANAVGYAIADAGHRSEATGITATGIIDLARNNERLEEALIALGVRHMDPQDLGKKLSSYKDHPMDQAILRVGSPNGKKGKKYWVETSGVYDLL